MPILASAIKIWVRIKIFFAKKKEKMGRWLSGKKTFCLITGASKGYGRVLAHEFAPHFAKNSVLLLLARNEKGLQAVQSELLGKAPDVKVIVNAIDLASTLDPDSVKNIIDSTLVKSGLKNTDFEQAVIIHNAGSVGKLALTEDCNDPTEWETYLALNLVSPICLNSAFLKAFPSEVVSQRLVINITSLVAIKPVPSLGMYNIGKAARESFFGTLAVEDPSVTVLNYSPGPMDTEMFNNVHKNIVHPKGKEIFDATVAAGKVLTCEASTKKLLSVLEKDSFASGARLEYFDL